MELALGFYGFRVCGLGFRAKGLGLRMSKRRANRPCLRVSDLPRAWSRDEDAPRSPGSWILCGSKG